jgi:hypothetical protein
LKSETVFHPAPARLHATLSAHRQNPLVEERAILDLHLLGEKQGASIVIESRGMELDFVSGGRREPSAPDNAEIASVEAEFGDIGGKTDEIVNMRLPHKFLHGAVQASAGWGHFSRTHPQHNVYGQQPGYKGLPEYFTQITQIVYSADIWGLFSSTI